MTLDNRKLADARFNDIQKELQHHGHSFTPEKEKRGLTINGHDQMAKVRSLQKEARQILKWKAEDNLKRGRTWIDGKEF